MTGRTERRIRAQTSITIPGRTLLACALVGLAMWAGVVVGVVALARWAF